MIATIVHSYTGEVIEIECFKIESNKHYYYEFYSTKENHLIVAMYAIKNWDIREIEYIELLKE